MKQPITGFHKDVDGDWVAQLSCGHFQHVRHNPPWTNRPWVTSYRGRESKLGYELECKKCDSGAPADVLIRPEQPADCEAIFNLNCAAFATVFEAKLVDCIRTMCEPLVSIVAEEGNEICGHILFSPVTLDEQSQPGLMGLGPMAVAPNRQGRGIGTKLVNFGLEACRKAGAVGVVVLGHPGFYPRFGFLPASKYGLKSEFDAPEEAFMALELEEGTLQGQSGRVKYHPAFSALDP